MHGQHMCWAWVVPWMQGDGHARPWAGRRCLKGDTAEARFHEPQRMDLLPLPISSPLQTGGSTDSGVLDWGRFAPWGIWHRQETVWLSRLGGVAGILVGTGLVYCWAPHNAWTGPPKSHSPNMRRGEGLTPAPTPSTSRPNPYTQYPSLASPGQPVLAASRSDHAINRHGPVPTKGPYGVHSGAAVGTETLRGGPTRHGTSWSKLNVSAAL